MRRQLAFMLARQQVVLDLDELLEGQEEYAVHPHLLRQCALGHCSHLRPLVL